MKKILTAILLLVATALHAQVWETFPSKKLTEVNTILLNKGYAKAYQDEDLVIYTKKISSSDDYKVTIMFSPKTKTINGVTVYTNSYTTFTSAENRYNEIKKALSEKYTMTTDKYEFYSPYNEDDLPNYKSDALTLDKAEIYTLYNCGNERYINLSLDYDVRSNKIAILITYIDMNEQDKFEEEKKEKLKSQY